MIKIIKFYDYSDTQKTVEHSRSVSLSKYAPVKVTRSPFDKLRANGWCINESE
jgi:hypothetical protein